MGAGNQALRDFPMRRLLFWPLTFLLTAVFSLPAFADKRVALVVGNASYATFRRCKIRQMTRGFWPKHYGRSASP